MTKLIILNGPLGAGKSTLAQRYVNDHPLALNLDIDDLRRHLGQWREQAATSATLSKTLAARLAMENLLAGNDVVVPQIYRHAADLEQMISAGMKAGAQIYEICLSLDKAEAIARFMDRGGFTPGGLLEKGGLSLLELMYDEMTTLAGSRPHTLKLVPAFGDIDDTYFKLLSLVNES